MSAYKKLNKQDAFITPYTAHKYWRFDNYEFADYGVDVFLAVSGSEIPNELFHTDVDPTTGNTSTYYRRLMHDSISHLYYSLQETGTLGSGSYDNFEQTTLPASSSRNLPVSASVISIPRSVIGNAIRPNTFRICQGDDQNYVDTDYIAHEVVLGSLQSYIIEAGEPLTALDDGEGNLIHYSASKPVKKVGDVIYPHGVVVLTDQHYIDVVTEGVLTYHLCFENDVDIFTHQYRCRVRESDLNHTFNPTALSGSFGHKHDNMTGSCSQPYITTVGLYNDAHELVAVGKLGQPYPKSRTTDMTFVVNLDI